MRAWNYLSSGFTNLTIPTYIQKRLYKFLLRKAIGQFISTELDLENFDIELVNGSVELRDLDLNLETLNELLIDTPFMLVQGHVSTITALLPWSNFWSGDITLKVHGLYLTLKPINEKRKKTFTTEEEESPIMSSSLHFADDFLRTEMEPDQNKELYESIQQLHESDKSEVDFGLEGLQIFTRIIDKMLAKVKVDITDTVIRIMHPSAVSLAGDQYRLNVNDNEYTLDIEVPKISYFDESPCFTDKPSTTLTSNMAESTTLLPNNGDDIIKIIMITSPKLWMRSIDNNINNNSDDSDEISLNNIDDGMEALAQTEFYEASEGGSKLYNNNASPHSSFMSGSATPRAYSFQNLQNNNKPYEALLFTTMNKENWIRFKTKASSPFDTQPSNFNKSIMNSIDIYFSHLRMMITPKQLSFLLDLFTSIPADSPISTSPLMKEKSSKKSSPNNDEVFKDQKRESSIDSLSPHSVLKDLESYQQQQYQRHSNNNDNSTSNISIDQQFNIDNPLQFSTVSAAFSSPSSTQIPNLKIKLQIPIIEMFLLYDDSSTLTPSTWESTISPPTTKISHIKFWIHQFIIRFQFFPHQSNDYNNKKRRSVAGSTLPQFDKSFQSSTKPPSSKKSSFILSSVLDTRIQSMGIDEWVSESLCPPTSSTDSTTPPSSIRMRYNRYIPILEFTDSICNDYDDHHIFPSYLFQSDPITTSTNNIDHEKYTKSKKEVIRIKIEKFSKPSFNPYDDVIFYNQDINADIQALKLTLDPKIIDRLENYVYAFLLNQKQNDRPGTKKNTQPSYTEQPFDQKIYEDLNKVPNKYQNQIHAKVKFSLIRLVLYAPDMSQSNTRDEYNDLYHGDILSVDVKKITASWKTDHSISQIEKIIVDLDTINVFLKLAKDNEFRCWFTAKSREKNNLVSSATSSPSMEISLRSSATNTPYATSSAKSCFFGTGSDIPNGLFEHLSRNESFYCEQKVSAPMEEQAESSMVFKQRTVETSSIVVNCHLPITYMSLSKKIWNKVQIIQNDLLLWQPRFIRYLEQQQQQGNADAMMSESMNSEMFNPPIGRRYSDISTHSINQLRASSIFSQSYEQFHEPQQHIQQKSSLLSLVAVMSEGIWNLQTDSKDEKVATYQLQFSDFRYFTVVNHLGKNENVTTLDIENLTLDDVTNSAHRIPLLNKTLPKSLIPKRNIPMVSLLSRLTTIPELNKQNKLTSVVACNICWRFTPDVTFLDNLIGFQKAPEDLVFIDPPTQYIKVFAHILDTSLDYKPLNIPSRAVIVIDNLQVITDILAGKPILDVKTFILNVDMLLTDDLDEMDEKNTQQISSRSWDPRRYWLKSGMSSVLTSRNLDTQVKIKLDEMALAPSVDLTILNDILTLEGCSDSFQSLLNFINYVANDGDEIFSKKRQSSHSGNDVKQNEKPIKKATHNVLRKTKEDMLASLDEDAFVSKRRQSSITQPSSLLSTTTTSSSLPFSTDLNLIEGFYVGSESGSTSPSSRKNPSRPNKPKRRNYPSPNHRHHHKKTTEDIIRLLIPDIQELDIIENFYSINQKKENRHKVVDTRHSLFSVRVRDVDIIWKLYNGYDWSYIRSNITSPSTSFSPDLNHQRRRSSNEPSSFNIPKSHSSSSKHSTINNNGDSKTSELGISFNRSSPNQLHRTHSISPSSPRTVGSFERSSPVHYHHQQHPHESGSHHGSDDFHYSSPSSYESKYSLSQSPTNNQHHHHRRSSQQEKKHHHQRVGLPDIELRIEGICLELDIMVPEEQIYLHSHLAIRDLEIVDNIKTSSWDTLLGYMRTESPSSPPRETDSNMITFDVTGIKPIKDDDTLEYRLRIHILPLRFYIDQDALNFLVQFFSFNQDLLHSTAGANLALSKNANHSSLDTDNNHNKKDNDLFFQHVEIHPLHLKIDYKPKYINYDNIKEGQFAELVNLFRLEDAKLNLSAVKMTGIKGIPKLLDRIGQEWLPHIKNTQIPGMVTGISPIRSVVNLGTGVANLVILPIQQYRKDGRIIKGLQKGTQSFAKTTAMELIKLSTRLALGTQVILEHADGLLSYGHSSSSTTTTNATTIITNTGNHITSPSSSSSILGSRNHHHDNELKDGMPSSSISSISTVIGSRTSDDMVLIITDKNIESEQDDY